MKKRFFPAAMVFLVSFGCGKQPAPVVYIETSPVQLTNEELSPQLSEMQVFQYNSNNSSQKFSGSGVLKLEVMAEENGIWTLKSIATVGSIINGKLTLSFPHRIDPASFTPINKLEIPANLLSPRDAAAYIPQIYLYDSATSRKIGNLTYSQKVWDGIVTTHYEIAYLFASKDFVARGVYNLGEAINRVKINARQGWNPVLWTLSPKEFGDNWTYEESLDTDLDSAPANMRWNLFITDY